MNEGQPIDDSQVPPLEYLVKENAKLHSEIAVATAVKVVAFIVTLVAVGFILRAWSLTP